MERFEPPSNDVPPLDVHGGIAEHGLYFVAYVAALDQFERVVRRRAGLDDRVLDGLLRFSRGSDVTKRCAILSCGARRWLDAFGRKGVAA